MTTGSRGESQRRQLWPFALLVAAKLLVGLVRIASSSALCLCRLPAVAEIWKYRHLGLSQLRRYGIYHRRSGRRIVLRPCAEQLLYAAGLKPSALLDLVGRCDRIDDGVRSGVAPYDGGRLGTQVQRITALLWVSATLPSRSRLCSASSPATNQAKSGVARPQPPLGLLTRRLAR